MDSKQEPRERQTLTASAVPPRLLAHIEAKQTKQAERQRLREDRLMLRARR